RLSSAVETNNSTQTWKQTFTYDRYGNRRFDEVNTTVPASFETPEVTNPNIDSSNHRLSSSGWSYDPSGNTTDDPSARTFVYDAENKQVLVSDRNGTIGEYFYDGDGKRVKKVVPSTDETTIFVYDAGGKLVAEYSTVVASTNDAKVAYLTNDHLGSPRINTDPNGVVTARHDYHPFGEEIATSQRTANLGYVDDTVRKQFTGYERDIESSLDFAEARMYNFQHGRFTSPDDFRNDSEPDDPQSWNLYQYVRNKPLTAIDPTGKVMTDYLDKNTGDITTVKDGKDQVIATDTAKINQMVQLSTTAGGQYWRELNVLEAYGESNLGLTRGEFDKLAGAVYAESSGGVGESAGIVDVLQNRADADGSTLMTQVSNGPGYGVRGVKSNAYSTESGPAADQKRRNVRMGIAQGIPGKDTTNGAYYWDGRDFNKNARGNNSGYQERIAKGGYLFNQPSHDRWNQGSLQVKGTYTYQSTAVIGDTTFSKLYAPKKSWRY
ncbi:MAG: hypothetical protein DMF63_15555, partial [Acidobacteria bacterium]